MKIQKKTTWPIAVRNSQNTIADAFQAWYRANPLTPEIARDVATAAWKISRRIANGVELRDEIEQRLLIALCRAADSWDPSRGSYRSWCRGSLEFASRQVNDALKRRSQRWARYVWIDEPRRSDDENDDEIELVSVRGVNQMIRELDLRAFRETLPDFERQLLEWLLVGFNRSSIARFLDLPRTTFDRKVWFPFVNKIQEFFND